MTSTLHDMQSRREDDPLGLFELVRYFDSPCVIRLFGLVEYYRRRLYI